MTRRRIMWSAAIVGALAVSIVWLTIPWEWSMIDDPGFVLSLRHLIADRGFLGGLVEQVRVMVSVDQAWGLFRPAYWVYPSLVYWMPIAVAHTLRLMMLGVAVAGPLVALRRRGAEWSVVAVAGLLMFSGVFSLMLGLFYVSLQELSGAAFIGLGLMSRGTWARIVLWTVAAWIKSPFAWLLLGEAVVLWRRGHRRAASGALVVGLGTLVVSAAMARSGSYTGNYLSGSLFDRVLSNVALLVNINSALVAVAFLAWLLVARSRIRWDEYSFVLCVGWFGYTVQMLPWAVVGHYQGGITYLWTVFLGSLLANPIGISVARTLVALTAPALTASISLAGILGVGFETNARFLGLTECLQRIGPVDAVLAKEFGAEAADRIRENVLIRDAEWRGSVTIEDPQRGLTTLPGHVLIVQTQGHTPIERPTAVVCSVPGAEVLK